MEEKPDGHVELNKREATQSTSRPPTQYVLGVSIAAVVVAFVALAIYWTM
jgi:hypothetical protein